MDISDYKVVAKAMMQKIQLDNGYGHVEGISYPSYWVNKIAKACMTFFELNPDKFTDEDIENINSTYPNGKWKNVFPYLSRDMGSKILNYVYNLQEDQIKLQNQIEFSKESLFCEYAYVIDLDNNSFEIYKGFNKTPIDEDQRFYWNNYQDNEYYPVKLHTKFNLTVLPDYDTLLKIDNTEEF